MFTADNWGQFMYDSAHKTPGCIDDPPYNPLYCGFNDFPGCLPLNGCGSVIAIPYWIIYIIFFTFVLLSVFISVIISTYQEVKSTPIKQEDYNEFKLLWSEIDLKACGYIHVDILHSFVSKLSAPFGFNGSPFTVRQYRRRVKAIKLYVIDNEFKVHYRDVVMSLRFIYLIIIIYIHFVFYTVSLSLKDEQNGEVMFYSN